VDLDLVLGKWIKAWGLNHLVFVLFLGYWVFKVISQSRWIQPPDVQLSKRVDSTTRGLFGLFMDFTQSKFASNAY
jgi:hypothetical protein